MPTMDIMLGKGCSDRAIEACLTQIPRAAEEILEHTKAQMLRISVLEAEPELVFAGGAAAAGIHPCVVFTVGPGRSAQAKQKFAGKITEILSENLGCSREEIRVYMLSGEGNHFAIGGRPKVFAKKTESGEENR